jgi:hypothetical protein
MTLVAMNEMVASNGFSRISLFRFQSDSSLSMFSFLKSFALFEYSSQQV